MGQSAAGEQNRAVAPSERLVRHQVYAVIGSGDIHPEVADQLLGRHPPGFVGRRDANVVDQHVGIADLSAHRLEGGVQRRRIFGIGREDTGLDVRIGQLLPAGVHRPFAAGHQHHPKALLSESFGNVVAESRPGTDHNHCFFVHGFDWL